MAHRIDHDSVLVERQRILTEFRRRDQDMARGRYAVWHPAEMLMRDERRRLATRMLQNVGGFPRRTDCCLEIGYGALGWLADLVSWGVAASQLHGIELNAARAGLAQRALPGADLRVGDAAELPWGNDRFRLVIASTVFSSILEASVRKLVAREMTRVLAPGGAVLWYDLGVNNPRNPQVRKISRQELVALFPDLRAEIRSVTLAPPIARWIAKRNWLLACLASGVPILRTHLLAVLVKPGSAGSPMA